MKFHFIILRQNTAFLAKPCPSVTNNFLNKLPALLWISGTNQAPTTFYSNVPSLARQFGISCLSQMQQDPPPSPSREKCFDIVVTYSSGIPTSRSAHQAEAIFLSRLRSSPSSKSSAKFPATLAARCLRSSYKWGLIWRISWTCC